MEEEKEKARAQALMRATFERLCAANVRRGVALLQRAHKRLTAEVIEIDVHRGCAKPSPALLRRLTRPSARRLVATSSARQEAAAARREVFRSTRHSIFVLKVVVRSIEAAGRREAQLQARLVQLEFVMGRSAARKEKALVEKRDRASYFSTFLVARASKKRAADLIALRAKLAKRAAALEGAQCRKQARLSVLPALRHCAGAIFARRAAADDARTAKGCAAVLRHEGAALRRAAALNARAKTAVKMARLKSRRDSDYFAVAIHAISGCSVEVHVKHSASR